MLKTYDYNRRKGEEKKGAPEVLPIASLIFGAKIPELETLNICFL